MPAANLLSSGLFHQSPVGELFLPRAVEPQGDPANHLLAFHTAFVVDGENERYIRKLEKGNLEDKRLFVGWVGLASTDRCFTLGHLVAHGIQ